MLDLYTTDRFYRYIKPQFLHKFDINTVNKYKNQKNQKRLIKKTFEWCNTKKSMGYQDGKML